jgi:hypothetical protein
MGKIDYSTEITGPSSDKTSLSAQLVKLVGAKEFEIIYKAMQEESFDLIEAIKANGQAERVGKGLPVQTRADIKKALEATADSINNGKTTVSKKALKAAEMLGINDPVALALIERMAIKHGVHHLIMEQGRADEKDTGRPSYPPSGNNAVLH